MEILLGVASEQKNQSKRAGEQGCEPADELSVGGVHGADLCVGY